MNPAWIGAISALSGVAVGAAAEAWRARLQFRREKLWELGKQMGQHLEQLYEAGRSQ